VTVRTHFKNFFRQCLWPAREKTHGGKTALRSRALEQYMQEGEQVQMRRREQALLALILQNPALLEEGKVEETLGRFSSFDATYSKIRDVLLGVWMVSGGLEDIPTAAADAGVQEAVARLQAADGKPASAQDYTADVGRPLRQWHVLAGEHTLIQMQLEERQLGTVPIEEMGDAECNRLIELKRQIAELEQMRIAAQNAEGEAAF